MNYIRTKSNNFLSHNVIIDPHCQIIINKHTYIDINTKIHKLVEQIKFQIDYLLHRRISNLATEQNHPTKIVRFALMNVESSTKCLYISNKV